MESGRFFRVLVVAATVLVGSGVASAKRAHKPKPPKVSDACTTDADCAFTKSADGDCCPSLCPPRVVSKRSAEALAKYAKECKKPEGGCPVPECMPPRMQTTAACVSGRCVARAAPAPTRD
ncbi:MAG TPA: hypothetical protein VF334_18075 [Polyangia bacterium]